MVNLEHPHVVRLQHVVLDSHEIHLVMALCSGGDLQAWIEDRWEEEFQPQRYYDSPGTGQVAVLSRQMLSAVAYIHNLSIAHRDSPKLFRNVQYSWVLTTMVL